MHDYHMHCHFCRHATGGIEEYVTAAADRGLEEICFTPHIPLPGFRPGFFNDRLRMAEDEFPRYLEELERARARSRGITILSGIEADYIEGTEEYLERFLDAHRFDFVLMSVHFIARWPDSQWVFGFGQDPRPLASIYDDYLAAVRAGIATGLFDCVAHLDLIKQDGKPLLASHRAQVEDILAACRDRGMSMEINTSGLRKDVRESYPAGDIVRVARDMGVPLTPGSDAHAPLQAGVGLETLQGFDLVRYRGRRMLRLA